MKKILFVKIGALGDLSYALPAAKLLKESLPCHLTWLVGKNYYSFLAGHPYIDQLILVNEKNFYSKNIFIRFIELLKLIFKIKKKFDYVIIAHRDKNYYRFFKLFSRSITFQLTRKTNLPPHFIYVPPLSLHESLAIKQLTVQAIKQIQSTRSRLLSNDTSFHSYGWEWDYSHIPKSAFNFAKPYLVLHTGGGKNIKTEFQLKCWPYWQELITKLLAENKYKIILIGNDSEQQLENNIISDKLINLTGKLNLQELIDVIRHCELLFGVDSGPLHIADSLNKKVIGLFGPTSPISWGLLSPHAKILRHAVPCSPCYQDDGIFPECRFQHRCMKSISVEEVLQAITQ